MVKYAKKTTVPISRSQSEIKKILERYGIEGHRFTGTRLAGGVEFVYNNFPIRMIFKYPNENDFRYETQYKSELCRMWRVFVLHVKSVMEMRQLPSIFKQLPSSTNLLEANNE